MRFFIYERLSEFAMQLASACHTSCIYIGWRAFTASFLGGRWVVGGGGGAINMWSSRLFTGTKRTVGWGINSYVRVITCMHSSCIFPRVQNGSIFSFSSLLSLSLSLSRWFAALRIHPRFSIQSFSPGTCWQVWQCWWDLVCDSRFGRNTDCYKLPTRQRISYDSVRR